MTGNTLCGSYAPGAFGQSTASSYRVVRLPLLHPGSYPPDAYGLILLSSSIVPLPIGVLELREGFRSRSESIFSYMQPPGGEMHHLDCMSVEGYTWQS
ncbi:hypothetical protein HanIR_Chr16g0797951 [Helianthus annuus]|nr:hypothetical protein HanIR_Chr16g0797951 [Helianthus annuus]